MAGRFVRASKFRHVYGQSTKKEQCYDNLRISRNAWDTNLIKANPSYISVNWEASGGGAFAVIPVNERGKLPERLPLFRGHTAAVLDTDWNPFDDNLIASGSDDAKIFLWRVPKGFTLYTDADEPADISPVGKLAGHTRKVGHVLFNPSAQNVLSSSSGDYSIKIWDIEQGKDRLSLQHKDIVQSMSWSANGALLVTTSRDKKLRVWDVRQEKAAVEVPGHSGAKNSRAVWMGELDRVATTGFSRMSDRQLGLWDIKNPNQPIGDFQILDSISGVCMPFWDDGTKMLYLAGKGDGNIRYFEYQNDKFEYLSEYKSADPQRGIAFLPKRGVNVHENEITRAYKTVNDTFIEPISFIVPRRAEVFQEDIYPPTFGLKPAVSSGDWFSGKTGLPPRIDLKGIYDGGEAGELPASTTTTSAPASAPSAVRSPSPAKKPAQPAAPRAEPRRADPEPVRRTEAMSSMKENKKAMEDMATRFAQKDADSRARLGGEEEEEDDDDSSFEEVPKPVERPAARHAEPARTAPVKADPPRNVPAKVTSPPAVTAAVAAPAPAPASSAGGTTASAAAEGLRSVLSDIKGSQDKTLARVEEVAEMVRMLGERLDRVVAEQSERIRRMELELEGLRDGE